jgi:hypothetical protein
MEANRVPAIRRSRARARTLAVGVLLALVVTGLLLPAGAVIAGAQAGAPTAIAPDDWLGEVNLLRALAGLPPVTEVPAWSAGDRDHAEWMVRNDTISHFPPSDTPGWTPSGAAAAQRSNLTISTHAKTDVEAVDTIMAVPFHGISVIDPLLTRTGFGSYHDPSSNGTYKWAAALDVLSDLEASVPRPPVEYPITWPTDGSTLHLTTYLGPEAPDPLAHCPGYGGADGIPFEPVGVPLYAMFAPGAGTTTSVTLTRSPGGEPLEVCWFDDLTYENPDAQHQQLGRDVLASRRAVVALPRDPLQVGREYRFTVVRSGVTATSTFQVGTEGDPGGFWDVTSSNPFEEEIGWLVDQGIAEGYPDGSFQPGNTVSRQAMAAYLYRFAGSPPPPSTPAGFVDVSPSHPFHDAIAWMVAEGYADGYSDGTFRPTGAVSRQAMAAYLYRYAGSPEGPFGSAGFVDVSPSHPFHDAIAWMVAEGITDGYSDGTFLPSGPITRQAAAAFLFRFAATLEPA